MVKNSAFLSAGNAAVASQMDALANLSAKLGQLAAISDRRSAGRIGALQAKLEEFAGKVTFVGQVKAGKSALVNVLSGQPGLLPSDVNPWTSVVTTLAINVRPPADTASPDGVRARFTFFDRDEWDKLTIGGGRLGELAERAGSADEMDTIRTQIEAMRAATEKRLGKHFQFLLGQNHSYGYVDAELIERYVCLGDAPEIQEPGSKTGRFADITRSAEIYIEEPAYAMPLLVCDTPGVNDTFMMREQITIRALRGSELCVVVLSAHQALTTSDMALLRIISNLENRQIIIFVNRVDELARPAEQIPEIRANIQATLQQNRIAGDVCLIFGSAAWAEAALCGTLDTLPMASLEALEHLVQGQPDLIATGEEDTCWNASGLPALLQAVGERISEGSAQRLYQKIGRSVRNLTNETRASLTVDRVRDSGATLHAAIDAADPVAAMNEISARYGAEIDKVIHNLEEDLRDRLDKAQSGFVKRATDSLIQHLQTHGEQGSWNYDPAGLRVLQRAAYTNFARSLRTNVGRIYEDAAGAVAQIYQSSVANALEDFTLAAPMTPDVPPPVGLGRTIALDLHTTWWRGWWKKRKGVEAFASDYVHLIRAEAQSMTDELVQSQARSVLDRVRGTFAGFISEQQDSIGRLAAGETAPAPAQAQSGAAPTNEERMSMLGEILRDLEAVAA